MRIQFSYMLLIVILCFCFAIYLVLKRSRFSESSLKEKCEAIIIFMLFFTVCSVFVLYFLKFFILQKVSLVFLLIPSSAFNDLTGNLFFLGFILFIIFSVLGLRIFSAYEFHSIGPNRIVFRRTIPLPSFMCRFANLLNILLFFLLEDRYLVIQALEIKRLPREDIRYLHHSHIPQETFKSIKIQRYEYEDLSAYLKKCRQGSQEISISIDGTVKVRRYVFGTSRRLFKAIENARFALIRMRGGLESLSFKAESDIVSEKKLSALTLLPEFLGYGQDRSVLCVQRKSPELSSYDTDYVSIILIEGQPEHKTYREMTQHDQFIRHCLNLQVKLTFVTNFNSLDANEQRLEQLKKEANDVILVNNDYMKILEAQKQQESSEYLIGMQSGFAKVSTYVLVSAKDVERCRHVTLDIENSLNTVYSGTHYSVKTSILEGRKLKRAYKQVGLKLSIKNETRMSVFRLSSFTHLPEKPVRGIESNYIPEFEIPLEAIDVDAGIEIGRVIFREKALQPLSLKIEDLRRSTTVIGLIGSGKTCLTKNMVLELSRKYPLVDWIVFDYKSEYTQLLPLIPIELLNEVIIFAPSSEYAPLQINIFDPCSFSPEEQADRVFSLICEVYSTMFQQDIDLSVQMERVLKDVLDDYIANPTARVKGFEGFLKALDNYAVQHKTKFSYLEKTVTALHNRLKKFTRGALKEIFDVSRSNVSFDELLQKKVIIDLGYLQSQGVPNDDIRFLMNFLVRLYGAHAIKRGLQHQLRNLIVVEECQFLVPELYKKQTSIDATPTEDLSILLRAYGVGFVFVGTRPLFAENSLANSYTIISFQLTKDAELLQKYMNLDERQVNYLKRMNSQECLIFSPTLKYPTRVRVNDFKGSDVTKEIIRASNLLNYPNLYENIVSDTPQNHFKDRMGVTKTISCEKCPFKETKEDKKFRKPCIECYGTTQEDAIKEGGSF
ncbi:MAG: ATP-binding protein [Promethearchaeota archaeon]